jgi:hypothetical protein
MSSQSPEATNPRFVRQGTSVFQAAGTKPTEPKTKKDPADVPQAKEDYRIAMFAKAEEVLDEASDNMESLGKVLDLARQQTKTDLGYINRFKKMVQATKARAERVRTGKKAKVDPPSAAHMDKKWLESKKNRS